MSKPDFTREELYLIYAVKSKNQSSYIDFHLAYLVPSAALIFFGFYHEEALLFLVAFACMASFTVWDLMNQRKVTPCWKSIIEKYEKAIDDYEKGG